MTRPGDGEPRLRRPVGRRVLQEQIDYYRARAPHYDDAYRRTGPYDRGPERNAAWFDGLAVVEQALAEVDLGREVVELGAGTGHWTGLLIRRGLAVTAVDAAPEALELAAGGWHRSVGTPNS